jgi:hypothetical protein
VAGPSSAATNFVLPVMEKTTPLRYRLQSKYYDLFRRNKRTPEKLLGGNSETSEEAEEVSADNEDDRGKPKRKRKVFGLIESRIFPKVSKGAVQHETQKLSEITVGLEDSAVYKCLLDCVSVIQRTLTQESASSLLSLCPVFFSKVEFLRRHMTHMTGGNDIFINVAQHYEFQMELIYQYLQNKLPKKDRLKV